MHDGTVQALRIIVDDQLPIRFQMVHAAFDHLKFCHAPRRELAVEPGQMLVEWNRVRRKIDKDMAVPDRGGDGVQRIVGFAEALHFFHVRRNLGRWRCIGKDQSDTHKVSRVKARNGTSHGREIWDFGRCSATVTVSSPLRLFFIPRH